MFNFVVGSTKSTVLNSTLLPVCTGLYSCSHHVAADWYCGHLLLMDYWNWTHGEAGTHIIAKSATLGLHQHSSKHSIYYTSNLLSIKSHYTTDTTKLSLRALYLHCKMWNFFNAVTHKSLHQPSLLPNFWADVYGFILPCYDQLNPYGHIYFLHIILQCFPTHHLPQYRHNEFIPLDLHIP